MLNRLGSLNKNINKLSSGGLVISTWTPLKISSKFLEGWKITGAGSLVGLVNGDILTVGGSAGSYTFQVPQTSDYINADADNIWVDSDGVTWRTITESELVSYDFAKTFVKYLNISPYSIQEVWILKAGQTLTTAEENHMRDYCQLSYWWSNVVSSYGVEKQNRVLGQSIWTPVTALYPTILTATVEDASRSHVILTFNHNIDTSNIPAITAFTLAGKNISTISILGAVVTITLSTNYAYGDVITIDYTKPSSNYLRDNATGGAVASFSGQSVTNNIIAANYLQDYFTGTNGTRLAAHTMNQGGGWTEVVGTWALNASNQLSVSGTEATWKEATSDAGHADVDLSLNIFWASTSPWYGCGVTFRRQDATHYFRAIVENDNSGAYVKLVKDGNLVDSIIPLTNNSSDPLVLRVVAKGNVIKIYVNDLLYKTVTDASYNTATLVGIVNFGPASPYIDLPKDVFIVKQS